MENLIRDWISQLAPHEVEALKLLLTNNFPNQHGVTVFTDGSCRNQGKKDAKAGFGVFWGEDHPNNISGKVHGLQDNNRAELYAACHAIRQAVHQGHQKIRILSDSEFVRLVIEKPADFEKIAYIDYHDLIQSINHMRQSIEVSVDYVKAHNGHYGNVQADQLARIGVRTVSLETIARYTKKIRKLAENRAKKGGNEVEKKKNVEFKKQAPGKQNNGVVVAKKTVKTQQTMQKTKKSKLSLRKGSSLLNLKSVHRIVEAQKQRSAKAKASKQLANKNAQVKSLEQQGAAKPVPPTVKSKKLQSVGTTTATPVKKPAQPKSTSSKLQSSNLNSLIHSLSKVSLTMTATQKRRARRQRAKVLADKLEGAPNTKMPRKATPMSVTASKPKKCSKKAGTA